MTSDWDVVPIRVAIKHAIGGGWGQDGARAGLTPVRVVRGTDFKNIRDGSLALVPRRHEVDRKVGRRVLVPNDIVIEISGGSRTSRQSTGRSLLITKRLLDHLEDPAIPASFCKRIRGESKVADPRYLYWFLQDMYNSGRAERYEQQSTGISNFQFEYFLDDEIFPVPPMREQRAIARVLGALDDRIELHRRMNATLEAMAGVVFKSWLVDFDPVRAKMEGRDSGLPQEVADLFPDRLVPSELGEIPEGWEVRTLGSCFELTMGQSPPGHTYNDTGIGLPFFQGRKDFGFRFPRRRQYCSKPTRMARPDDTLVSVRAPVGDINMASERCCVGRGLAALRHRSGSPSFTYYSALAMQLALRTFEGTGTVFGAITKEQFNGKLVLEPSADLVTAFDAFAGPTDDQIRTIASSLEGLIQVRDTLLPKLVSGEVRLPSALVERYGANSATAAT